MPVGWQTPEGIGLALLADEPVPGFGGGAVDEDVGHGRHQRQAQTRVARKKPRAKQKKFCVTELIMIIINRFTIRFL